MVPSSPQRGESVSNLVSKLGGEVTDKGFQVFLSFLF
jgi:hypothetical protein